MTRSDEAPVTTNEPPSHGRRPTASELLATPGAMLNRGHLTELGLGRAHVDAVFRKLTVYVIEGASRPMVRVEDYLRLLEASAYDDDRVRLTPRNRMR